MTRLLALPLLLAACAPATAPGPVCPPLVAYTPAEQAQAAAELRAPPPKPMLGQMIADYITLRDQIRSVCR